MRNCLTVTLDRWVEQGGYLVVRKSAARAWPHVLHIGDEGLMHFAPGAPLGHPVRALMGYDGAVWDRELADAPPVPVRGVIVGSLLLVGGVFLWAIQRKWLACWARMRGDRA